MAVEETEEKKTCLDMPYRHLTKLSTRTNMIHMNIGDKGEGTRHVSYRYYSNLIRCNSLVV
jgi:hypothetical protein